MGLIWKGFEPKNILHSSESPDWYTPKPIAHMAREVMGSIDLDPASDAKANEVIQAKQFFTEQDNGLKKIWCNPDGSPSNVFLNPPGGLVNEFWMKLLEEVYAKNVGQFIWVGFSLEQLQTLQSIAAEGYPTPLGFSMCIPRKRIPFVENAARREARKLKCLKEGKAFKEKVSPTHANYISYSGKFIHQFKVTFEMLGEVTL